MKCVDQNYEIIKLIIKDVKDMFKNKPLKDDQVKLVLLLLLKMNLCFNWDFI